MVSAYVLLNTDVGLEEKVLEKVKSINGVVESFLAYGVFDVIAKVNADSMDELKELITHRLRRIKSVNSTLTLILVEK